jgi:cyclophilin family peptidyl-prolyl cis-trans isomerase
MSANTTRRNVKKLNALFLACLMAGTLVSTQSEAAAASNTVVRFHFTYGTFKLGDIDVELFDQDKPLTVSNFLAQVQSGVYDNGIIHRCDPNFVIQGGLYSVANPYSSQEIATLLPIPEGAPIPDEYNVGPQHSNTFGTLAMALSSLDDGTVVPNSATASWFFNIYDNSSAPVMTNYTVFGRVTAGSQYLTVFTQMRPGGRIVDMFAPTYHCGLLTIGDQTDVGLDELPVAYLVDCPYFYSDLFTVQINVVRIADTVPPTVTLSYPTKNLIVSNGTMTASGTVADAVGLERVRVYLEPGTNGPIEATVLNNNTWSALISDLSPGTNRLVVEATDTSGNRSTAQAQFYYRLRLPITLSLAGTSGSGTIKGATNGQLLEVGKWYTITATPAPGNLFAGWSSPSSSFIRRQPTLLFPMLSNLAITAIFNTNHFPEVKGTYTGLFYQTNLVEERSSGFITLTVADRGSYTAKLTVEGKVYRLSGVFDSGNGESKNNTLVRNGSNNITLNLTLDLGLGTDRLIGDLNLHTNSMTDVWTATLNADRSVFNARTNPAAFAGKYTMIFPSTTNSPAEPGGDGYATVSVSTGGGISFKGELADGTKVTQKAPLSKNGEWPLYLSPYKGKGSLLSWVAFDPNQPMTDLNGTFYWFKQAQAAKYYSGGFTNDSMIAGSRFTPPNATNRMLDVTNVVVGFTNGNLPAEFANNAMVDALGKVTDLDLTNKFKMTISKANGSFNGSVLPPGVAKATALKGVVLQKAKTASGFFVNTNQSGRVSIGP